MLEPREADIPALFLVFVVLPLVAYVLLGKWSEASKKRERVSLLAQLAAEEALRAEAMAVADVIPPVSPSKNGLHACARCFSPATTRCSRCKSVRYCSGKCQIIHWREVHRQECLQLEPTSSSSSPKSVSFGESFHEKFLLNDSINSQYFGCKMEQILAEEAPADNIMYPSISTGVPAATVDCASVDPSQVPMLERKRVSRKSNRELFRKKVGIAFNSSEEASCGWTTQSTPSNVISSKDVFMEHKLRNFDSHLPEEENRKKQSFNISDNYIKGQATSRNTVQENDMFQSQHGNIYESRSNSGLTSSSYSSKCGTDVHEIGLDFIPNGGNPLKGETTSNVETTEYKCTEMTALKASVKAKRAPYSLGTKVSKLPKSTMEVSGEQYCSEIETQGHIAEDSKVARMRDTTTQGSNGIANLRIMKMMGLKKPKTITREDAPEVNGYRHKTRKVLFPYDEFVKYFQCEVFDLSPRGLLNCGNSCYANAVLQCLTCTKPLIMYLLRRSHSSACCGKDWCLMCELEQHVMMLRESGGPLSPSRILFHMRSINCQIGDGSQEDAHEFLRLLITSMQSICLEGLGGENKVDPRLQETTFIQHTFGGHLRSKVKCLRCHHESERYENIMDLTLEIFGWVESLEDALTQFTTPEDLDGENMYRCGRCAAYVRARKQLSIHEAPNILTIVLKRFQEGKYGKINKCITFPDMLDMVPFMTGKGDIPPLYLLYAVVVHLDTQNASFSGHYVAYVKDMRGNWFRIDDTQVQPVSMSQVMMEGAYILFYMRSCPRPQRAFTGKSIRQQVPNVENHCMSKAQKSRPGQSKHSSQFVSPVHLPDDIRPEIANSFANSTSSDIFRSSNGNVFPMTETYGEPIGVEFSDATSSDWSLFTSSDEASFTTESTRDSFSTVDYADAGNISSIFNTLYAPEYSRSSVSCRKFSNSRPNTRFVSKDKGLLLDSYLSTRPIDRVQNRNYSKQVSDSPTAHPPDGKCSTFVRYGSNPVHFLDRTSDHCKL
ncbi:PREDICTED: ubiquitin carboxyl-terminal hydrolase 15 isoform X1 [Prunus mume]|uniref:Ubiquitin carboxyl-terminal hydrolase 15 isoform X1 n=1 Tax=Prunus mume TaxID=102107 RepID=A0ABM0NKQ3_PRUMU|nr:PREDICTED: ubiquitin carboxyl-terminal hydrolase 15 isoform X1 [Prunus mume]XP_008226233.1 PREDICTED: ubiquitin carboxyl-terminal hydrolase 15 isoform X1 [Prunus mume]XP_008226234.1 PREDICTED: ubiquitin carboxyl-terminal hydrolase 15 isoform X1 [Prunus mume]